MTTIDTEKDIITTELERIAKTQLDIPCTFMEADLKEANFGMDKVPADKFPVLLYIATTKNKSDKLVTDVIVRKATVVLMLLDEDQAATLDQETADITAGIERMRKLGENLWYWINKSPYSVNGGIDTWQSDAIAKKFDRHCFGQAIEAQWTLDEGKTGYYNSPQA